MGVKVIARNRKAGFDYHLLEHFEAGMALMGSEIKAIRASQMSIKEAYVRTNGQEAWLVNAHIAPYDPASRENHEARRDRKLLLHRKQIETLWESVQRKGLTIVPTRVYLKDGLAKVEIAIARGKHKYDKRQAIKQRDTEREIQRAMRER